MTEPRHEDIDNTGAQGKSDDKKQQQDSDSLREVSYVVLFVGVVFVINAMETGSYSTPWPVAIITGLTGLGLFAYSFTKRASK